MAIIERGAPVEAALILRNDMHMHVRNEVAEGGVVDLVRAIDLPDRLGSDGHIVEVSLSFFFSKLEILGLVILELHDAAARMLLIPVKIYLGILSLLDKYHEASQLLSVLAVETIAHCFSSPFFMRVPHLLRFGFYHKNPTCQQHVSKLVEIFVDNPKYRC